MIDENIVFIALITIFAIFIIRKQPYLIATIILIVIFYYLYKSRFTNPKEFLSFITNKTKEAFEVCSSGNMAYCGSDTTTNSNMTFLPEIIRSGQPTNNINSKGEIVLKIEDYQIDKRLKFGGSIITIDEIIASVPPLIDNKIYLDKLIKFTINI